MIRRPLLSLIIGTVIVALFSCQLNERQQNNQTVAAGVSQNNSETQVSWSTSDLRQVLQAHKGLSFAWQDFERSQKYRLAQPFDRRLSAAAAARVKSNNPNQIKPFLTWWGAHGYRGDEFLIAIVVDPSRFDPNRYGLIVIAAPRSEGRHYKSYWVAKEEDMESYLISPASGSVYMECFRRDGIEQTRELVWEGKSRLFRLR